MKNLIAFLAFIMMTQAYAQAPAAQVQVIQAQPQAPIIAQPAQAAPKKTLIYDERTNQLVEVAPQVQATQQTAPVVAEATATAPSNQPIYILNNQKLQGYQGAIQDAPTAVVQEAPARVSASESLRKERHGAETATEDGIVMTLEKARLEDEVRRREKFNNALSASSASASATVVVPAGTASGTTQAASQSATASSIVNAPNANNVITTTTATNIDENEVVEIPAQRPQKKTRKKVILEDETTSSNVDVKAEVRAALAEQNAAPLNLTSYYVSGLVGTANYNDGANIRGRLSSGVAFGIVTPERFVAEGSFTYGQFQVDDFYGVRPTYSTLDMDQYNWSVGAKYQLLPGRLRPAVGALASYTRRNYSFAGFSNGDSILTTDAFDAGLQAGLDLALTNNFSIGADFKYMWNIASKNNANNNMYRNGYYNYGYGSGYTGNGGFKVVEDLSYYIASLSAKFTF